MSLQILLLFRLFLIQRHQYRDEHRVKAGTNCSHPGAEDIKP